MPSQVQYIDSADQDVLKGIGTCGSKFEVEITKITLNAQRAIRESEGK
jgi:hypothetical protein